MYSTSSTNAATRFRVQSSQFKELLFVDLICLVFTNYLVLVLKSIVDMKVVVNILCISMLYFASANLQESEENKRITADGKISNGNGADIEPDIRTLLIEAFEMISQLNQKIHQLDDKTEKLSVSLEMLQVASKDLLYQKYLELEEEAEAEDLLYYEDWEESEIESESLGRAVWYLRAAAEAGHGSGQLQLGIYYDSGYGGLNQSSAIAFEWYLRAAQNNVPEAQCYVGMAYHLGRGVNQSDEKAVEWYRMAAENKDSIAQNNLGWMLLTGGN